MIILKLNLKSHIKEEQLQNGLNSDLKQRLTFRSRQF